MMFCEGMRHLLFLQPHFSSRYVAAPLSLCAPISFLIQALSPAHYLLRLRLIVPYVKSAGSKPADSLHQTLNLVDSLLF